MGRHAMRHRLEPAGRAVADERRPGPRDHLGWASARASASDRRHAEARSRVAELRKFLDELAEQVRGGDEKEQRIRPRRATPRSSRWPRTCPNGVPFATPVFDGAAEKEIERCCSSPRRRSACQGPDGQLQSDLFDGRNGR